MGFWPIQRFTSRSLSELHQAFCSIGIDRAWVSAIESILFPEPDSHDLALFEQLKDYPRFQPVKTVNPLLANWKKSLEQTLSRFPLAAVKLFPNYHGYSLKSEAVEKLCQFARQRHLPLLIQIRVNDERNQPHFMQVNGVPADEIAELSARHPNNPMVALCAYNNEVAALAKGSASLMVDLSFLDEAETIERFAGEIDLDRIVFGSGAPFLHAQAAYMKLTHFKLPETRRNAVASENLLSRISR